MVEIIGIISNVNKVMLSFGIELVGEVGESGKGRGLETVKDKVKVYCFREFSLI